MPKHIAKVAIIAAFISLSALCASAQHIAVLSDIHVSPGTEREAMLKVAVEEINAADFDFVVVNGDLTNEGSNAELSNVKLILDQISHPLHALPGNHENNWSQSATMEFPRLWGSDRFAAVHDSLIVVGINCGPYMKMGDGHIKQEDLHWLRHALDSLADKGNRVLSFCHYPVRANDLDNYADYATVLSDYPVIAQIAGHYHAWIQYETAGMNAAMVRALMLPDDTFGYTILNIDADSVKIYDKELGKQPVQKFSFPARVTIDKDKALALQPRISLESPAGFAVEKLWTDSASIFTRLGSDKDNIYFGTSTGIVKAYNKKKNKLAWQLPVGGAIYGRITPLGNGTVAIPHCNGITIAKAKNGKVVRHIPTSEGPYVADGVYAPGTKSYIQGGYKRVEARTRNGELLWSLPIDNYCQAAPAVDGNDLIFGAWDSYLRCVDLSTGELKWQWNNGKSQNMLGPGNVVPVVCDDKVIIVAPDRYMTAIDRNTGNTIWRDNSHRYRESLGRSQDGAAVYAKTMDGELVAVAADGYEFKELWITDMGIGYDHAPCVIAERNGIVYVGSRRGIVTAIDASKHNILWQLQLGSSEINAIDVDADGTILISLIEGSIYRITEK